MSSHSEHEAADPVGLHAEDEYDALADLFLGERPEARPNAAGPYRFPGPGARPTNDAPWDTRVEGLVVGHLPVLASAWISQYARHRRRELDRPVALVRLRGGHVQIDLHDDASHPPCDTIGQAIRRANAIGAAWILRVDEPDEPRLAESGLDDLTLLTGANQAAIVGSYRVIKRLAGPDEVTTPSRLRIAAMGSPEDHAGHIGDKIKRAASTFLGREVDVAAVIDRIEPGPAATIYEGDVEWTVEHLVERIRAETGATTDSHREPKPARGPVQASAPAGPPSTTGRRPLASHLEGLVAVPATCPYADGVELARDRDGALHLLARLSPGATDRLRTARAWAEAHAALLSAAHGPLDALDATMHVLASDVPATRPLLDTELRVHLLAPVEVDGRRGWFCTPLN